MLQQSLPGQGEPEQTWAKFPAQPAPELSPITATKAIPWHTADDEGIEHHHKTTQGNSRGIWNSFLSPGFAELWSTPRCPC